MITAEINSNNNKYNSNIHAENIIANLAGGEMNNLECVTQNASGHELFAIVATVHHHGVDNAFNDWALKWMMEDIPWAHHKVNSGQ